MARTLLVCLAALTALPALAEPIDRSGLRGERQAIRDERRALVTETCDPRGAQNCVDARQAIAETQPERLQRRDERRAFRRELWSK